MKIVILAGGLGTRISEETQVRPKPMVEIGGMPILWHIMKMYSHFGYSEFVVCLGYKGEVIKEWFAQHNANGHENKDTFDFVNKSTEEHSKPQDAWKVTLVDTGAETMTGGRLARVRKYIDDERFMMTYGDGVSDVNIQKLVAHHEAHGRKATMTTVIPEPRFGEVKIDGNDHIFAFSEKTDNKQRVNGGFFVLEPSVFEFLTEGDTTIFEKKPLERLAEEGELISYPHEGFWKPMDTLSDKHKLEVLWEGGAPWKLWN
ncbi:glucose-1-phosphate cytidylyltransferase [bacterium]|nr:glucose-1-phosphate cytidylyltransferase [bacterium]|tara:strand:+ start:13220 stop:13996 length:777 start_codon:yes stop_codon:yes gene_type:complete